MQKEIDEIRSSAARLDAVLRTRMLDSPIEDSFDRLSRLATKLLDAPIAFLSLIDADRDFYKSCVGFDEAFLEIREMSGLTFCHHTLLSDVPLVIPDTLANDVFSRVPTVQSLGVRAYLGVPLITSEGNHIGSFCVIDKKPRVWSSIEIETATELAASALREITLQALAKEAQQAIVEKERLIATAAHDLRSPLAAIVLSFERATRSGVTEPAKASATKRFWDATNTMTSMLAEMLEAPTSAADRTTIKPECLVADALGMMELLVEQRQMRLINRCIPGLPPAMVDYRRTLRVFANLIGNAVKFSPPKAEIVLNATQDGSFIRFTVSDSGVGIPSADQDRIFDARWQANPGDLRGAGLGLSIVRQIVEDQGGSIGVESVEGEGSTFFFRLPIHFFIDRRRPT